MAEYTDVELEVRVFNARREQATRLVKCGILNVLMNNQHESRVVGEGFPKVLLSERTDGSTLVSVGIDYIHDGEARTKVFLAGDRTGSSIKPFNPQISDLMTKELVLIMDELRELREYYPDINLELGTVNPSVEPEHGAA